MREWNMVMEKYYKMEGEKTKKKQEIIIKKHNLWLLAWAYSRLRLNVELILNKKRLNGLNVNEIKLDNAVIKKIIVSIVINTICNHKIQSIWFKKKL